MKKYLIGAIVIVSAIISAFSTKPVTKVNESKEVSLYWFVGSSYTGRQNTHASEVPLSGCPDSGTNHCENGYDANDFNTIGDPNSGLKAGATLNDIIRKP